MLAAGVQHAATPPALLSLSVSLYNHILSEQRDDDGEYVILSLSGGGGVWRELERLSILQEAAGGWPTDRL